MTLRKPPGAYPGPPPFPGDRPGAPQSHPSVLPERRWPALCDLGTSQGPLEMQQVCMLKTLEIYVFGLSELQKITLELFFGPPRPPSDASNSATLLFRVDPGRPQGVPGSPRDLQKGPKACLGISQVAHKASQDRSGSSKKVPRPARASPRASVLTKTVF